VFTETIQTRRLRRQKKPGSAASPRSNQRRRRVINCRERPAERVSRGGAWRTAPVRMSNALSVSGRKGEYAGNRGGEPATRLEGSSGRNKGVGVSARHGEARQAAGGSSGRREGQARLGVGGPVCSTLRHAPVRSSTAEEHMEVPFCTATTIANGNAMSRRQEGTNRDPAA